MNPEQYSSEYYKRLCIGEDAGQVDVAAAYPRGMLAVLHPHDRSWAAPVVFTHTPDGAIYRLPQNPPAELALDPVIQRARLATLYASLQTSAAFARIGRWLTPARCSPGARRWARPRKPIVSTPTIPTPRDSEVAHAAWRWSNSGRPRWGAGWPPY